MEPFPGKIGRRLSKSTGNIKSVTNILDISEASRGFITYGLIFCESGMFVNETPYNCLKSTMKTLKQSGKSVQS